MAILFSAGRFKATDKANEPISGAFLAFYATLTSAFQPVYTDSSLAIPLTNPVKADANGLFPEIWLDDSLPPYKVTHSFPDASDPTLTGSIIWTIAQYNTTLSSAALVALLNPTTAAENNAQVQPVNYAYPAGHILRYGNNTSPGTTDMSAALTAAINQAMQAGGASVYLPSSTYKVQTAPPTITTPIKIYGDGYGSSVISTSNDITLFSFTLNSSQSEISDLQLSGKGGNSTTNPAVLFTNSNFNLISRCYIHSFGVGVSFTPGANSSYLNIIRDSQIVQNRLINIDAQKLTNALQLFGVTFGGGNTATGLKLVDSSNLLVSGFDIEGCTTVGIDIDNPTVANLGGHVIQGGDIEGGTSTFSSGAIRLGSSNVNPVLGVLISGINSAAGGSDDSFLNAVNCGAVDVRNIFVNSGFAGASLIDGWLRLGANAKNITTGNVTTVSGNNENLVMPYNGLVCDGQAPLSGSAPATANGGSISTASCVVSRIAPAGNITGVVLQSGTRPGQRVVVVNESAFTVTFAVAGTSAVADGTSDQMLANTAREFVWDSVTSLWYRKG